MSLLTCVGMQRAPHGQMRVVWLYAFAAMQAVVTYLVPEVPAEALFV
jgi:hypothetical protein